MKWIYSCCWRKKKKSTTKTQEKLASWRWNKITYSNFATITLLFSWATQGQMTACPLVVNDVELVSSRFWWYRASLEPVVLMTYGKNGVTCWLAGAVRTLQKRVEMLEVKDSFKNVECSIHVNISVSRHKSDDELWDPKTRVQRCECPDTKQQTTWSTGMWFLRMTTCKIWKKIFLSWTCLQYKEMTSSRYWMMTTDLPLRQFPWEQCEARILLVRIQVSLCPDRRQFVSWISLTWIRECAVKTLLTSWIAKISRCATKWKLHPFVMCPLRRLGKWWSSILLYMRYLLPWLSTILQLRI